MITVIAYAPRWLPRNRNGTSAVPRESFTPGRRTLAPLTNQNVDARDEVLVVESSSRSVWLRYSTVVGTLAITRQSPTGIGRPPPRRKDILE